MADLTADESICPYCEGQGIDLDTGAACRCPAGLLKVRERRASLLTRQPQVPSEIRNLMQPIRIALDRAKMTEEGGADIDFSDMLDDADEAMSEILKKLERWG